MSAALLAGGDDAFTVQDPRISESSGLAASAEHPGIVYTHNDSGHPAQIFALDAKGRTRATYTLDGVTARDWEGIALGKDEKGRPAIYIADTGDNRNSWDHVAVYRIREPKDVRSRTLQAEKFRFTYRDGPRDAETIMIDPRDNRLYIASKSLGSGRLYVAPKRLRADNVLTPVARAHSFATDGAFAPDGTTFVIRGYYSASLYSAPGKVIETISLPSQEQGEGITYAADGRSLLVSTEGVRQKVLRVPLPEKAQPVPTETASESQPKEKDGSHRGVGLLALVGVVVVAVLCGRRRK
ncbi:MAG: hypothetical protein ABIS86_05125 [Streptosporangiaceae bacterium]